MHFYCQWISAALLLNFKNVLTFIQALEISKNILCAVFNKNGDLITGHSNGGFYVWRRNKIDHAIHNAHNGPITAMCFTKHGYLLTGSSREDVVLVWDEQMKCIFKEDKVSIYSIIEVRLYTSHSFLIP